jgi:hypothetical protein
VRKKGNRVALAVEYYTLPTCTCNQAMAELLPPPPPTSGGNAAAAEVPLPAPPPAQSMAPPPMPDPGSWNLLHAEKDGESPISPLRNLVLKRRSCTSLLAITTLLACLASICMTLHLLVLSSWSSLRVIVRDRCGSWRRGRVWWWCVPLSRASLWTHTHTHTHARAGLPSM